MFLKSLRATLERITLVSDEVKTHALSAIRCAHL